MTARRVNGQTYGEWRESFLASTSLTLPMDLMARRAMLYKSVPRGFLPSADQQQWSAFLSMDAAADKRAGQVYVLDPSTARPQVDEYVQLAFDEFRAVCIRRASLAAADVDRIREMAVDWSDAHPAVSLDVDTFMADVKQAAGL